MEQIEIVEAKTMVRNFLTNLGNEINLTAGKEISDKVIIEKIMNEKIINEMINLMDIKDSNAEEYLIKLLTLSETYVYLISFKQKFQGNEKKYKKFIRELIKQRKKIFKETNNYIIKNCMEIVDEKKATSKVINTTVETVVNDAKGMLNKL